MQEDFVPPATSLTQNRLILALPLAVTLSITQICLHVCLPTSWKNLKSRGSSLCPHYSG